MLGECVIPQMLSMPCLHLKIGPLLWGPCGGTQTSRIDANMTDFVMCGTLAAALAPPRSTHDHAWGVYDPPDAIYAWFAPQNWSSPVGALRGLENLPN